jgi:hypothetical protein
VMVGAAAGFVDFPVSNSSITMSNVNATNNIVSCGDDAVACSAKNCSGTWCPHACMMPTCARSVSGTRLRCYVCAAAYCATWHVYQALVAACFCRSARCMGTSPTATSLSSDQLCRTTRQVGKE